MLFMKTLIKMCDTDSKRKTGVKLLKLPSQLDSFKLTGVDFIH